MLYAHPWQAARLRDEYPWLTDDGETGPVRPLMSLRTVAPVDGGDHIKTAVDVQMTSAVRTVSPAAVHNGPRLSALLRTLTRDLPLTVLAETAAGAVIVDGQPQRRLAYLRRQAPAVRPEETVVPLAALAAGEPPLIVEAVRGGDGPYRWFEDLALILWPPLLAVLDRGVALEAHGQNTLVVLRDGRPIRILYRDLGGVRVSPARLRAAGVEAPPLLGDLPSDDPDVLRTKLAASAVTVVAAELVGLLERHHGADPARLWGIVAAAIRGAGTADAAAILRGPLPLKATTAMRLAADPLDDIWAAVDNPLAGASMTRSLTAGRLAVAAAHAEAALAVHAPHLVDAYTGALPEAADIVGRRLRGALVREDIGDARARHARQGVRHAFDRVEFASAGVADPVHLLAGLGRARVRRRVAQRRGQPGHRDGPRRHRAAYRRRPGPGAAARPAAGPRR